MTEDAKSRDVCEFEFRIDSLDDKLLSNEDQLKWKNNFQMINKLNVIYIYLNALAKFESASVSINCIYKNVTLHRTELHFNQDNI